jgi:pimeloyl-ACP methyl ester carboxylesterase
MLWPLLSLFVHSQTIVGTFQQAIDHSDSSVGNFAQYYFEVTDFFDPVNGVVILKIGSEVPDLAPAGESDWFRVLARHFKATVVTLQHRYFGKSQPFPDTSLAHLQYLTVDQALQDYRDFHDRFVSSVTGQTAANLKWIIIGGSYPGLLSANIRRLWPDRFAAGYSSAGVVFATNNYTDFDLQDAIAMGQECAAVARQTRLKLERLYAEDRAYVLKLFNMPDFSNDFDFYLSIGELFTVGPQFSDVNALCAPLLDTLRLGTDPVIALAEYVKRADITFEDLDVPYLQNETVTNERASRGWFWMTCNEVGYWQTWPGRVGLRSKSLTTAGFEDKCQAVFGQEMHPDVEHFNQVYNVTRGNNVSHVIFTTNSQDPWAWTCVGQDTLVDDDNWVHVVAGNEVGHHREFDAPTAKDPADMNRTRSDIIKLLDKWLEWGK